MDFKPFEPPPTDYHGLNTGIGEGGITAKGFVEGINKYLGHLFGVVKRETTALDTDVQQWVANHFASISLVSQLEARISMLENMVHTMTNPAGKTEAPPAPPAPPATTVLGTPTTHINAPAPVLGSASGDGVAGSLSSEPADTGAPQVTKEPVVTTIEPPPAPPEAEKPSAIEDPPKVTDTVAVQPKPDKQDPEAPGPSNDSLANALGAAKNTVVSKP